MTWLAIMRVEPDGRVAKYAEFDTDLEALAHVTDHGQRFANAFVVERPAGSTPVQWRADPAAKTINASGALPDPAAGDITAEEIWQVLEGKGVVQASDRPRPGPSKGG